MINLEQGVLTYKEIINEKSHQNFIDLYEQYNKELEQCHLIFKKILDSNDNDSYFCCKQVYNIQNVQEIFHIDFNAPNVALKNFYNEQKYFEFASLCSFYHIIVDYLNKRNQMEKIKKIYEIFFELKDKIQNDSNLENYQKIIIILDFRIYFPKITDIKFLNKINFSYYLTKTFESD